MKTILVTDMLRLNTLDFMIDVHLHGTVHEWEPVDEPMIRKVQKVYLKTEKGENKNWLYWEWQENNNDYTRGYRDCGYSGICIDNEDLDKLYFTLDKKA